MDSIVVRFAKKNIPHLYVEDIKGLTVQDGTVAFYTTSEESREDFLLPLTSIMYVKIREELS